MWALPDQELTAALADCPAVVSGALAQGRITVEQCQAIVQTDAAFKISFARRNSVFSRHNRRFSSTMSVVDRSPR